MSSDVDSEPTGWDASADDMYTFSSDDDTTSECSFVEYLNVSRTKKVQEKNLYKTIIVDEKDFLPE